MKAIEKELSKTFTINVSELRHFTEEEIKKLLQKKSLNVVMEVI